MKPTHSKRKSVAFTVLTLVVILGNFLCAYLNYVIWFGGEVAETVYQRIVDSPIGLEGSAALVAAFGFVGTGLCHILSFDPHRRRRPTRRLFGLFFSFFVFVAAYALGVRKVPPDHIAVFAAAVVACLLLPLVFIYLERLLGRFFLRLGRGLYRHHHPRLALPIVRLGLRFYPADPQGETFYGLTLAARSKTHRAMPYLEDAYAQGQQMPEVLLALADIYEQSDLAANAIRVLEELQQVRPSPEILGRLIRLFQQTGNDERALQELNRLPEEERQRWLDTVQELLLKKGEPDELRTFCTQMEQEGPPFTRSRTCYTVMLERHPDDAGALQELIRLNELAGDREQLLEQLERLVALKPDDSQSRRHLIQLLRKQGRTADVEQHLEQLVNRDATVSEKMEVIESLFSRAEYARVEELVQADPRLQEHGRAAGMLASIYFETGRREEALEQARKAREMKPDARTERDLAVIEHSVTAEKKQAELELLEQQATAEPDNVDLQFRWLKQLVADGAVDRVIVNLDRMIARHPELEDRVRKEIGEWTVQTPSYRLSAYLADLYLRENDFNKVHEIYEQIAPQTIAPAGTRRQGAEKILYQNPAHLPSLLTLAQLDAQAGDFKAALESLDRYLAGGGERTSDVIRMEFTAATHVHDSLRAQKAGMDLLEQGQSDIEIIVAIANSFLAGRKYDEGLNLLRRAAEMDPENREVRRLLRESSEAKNRARMEEIRQLLASDDQQPALHEELGDLAHDFGLLNEAIVAYQRAAIVAPDQNVARAKLGYVLAKKGLHGEAEEALNDAQMGPKQAMEELSRLKALFFSTGELMEQDGEEARALKLYKRIFKIDAGYRDVVARVERLQRGQGKKKNRM